MLPPCCVTDFVSYLKHRGSIVLERYSADSVRPYPSANIRLRGCQFLADAAPPPRRVPTRPPPAPLASGLLFSTGFFLAHRALQRTETRRS